MAFVTRKFTVEELEEKYDLPWNPIYEETIDKRRWYSVVELVFKADDGLHYTVYYMDPATEMQDGQDRWEDSRGYVEGIQVEPVEVVTVKWEAIKCLK